jgi:hypothetical protein
MFKKSNRLFMATAAVPVIAVMVLPGTFYREELYHFLGS